MNDERCKRCRSIWVRRITPKALNHSAQGREERATLGDSAKRHIPRRGFIRGARFDETLRKTVCLSLCLRFLGSRLPCNSFSY